MLCLSSTAIAWENGGGGGNLTPRYQCLGRAKITFRLPTKIGINLVYSPSSFFKFFKIKTFTFLN